MLLSVTVCAALVVLRVCAANVRLAVLTEATGEFAAASAFPDNATVCVVPFELLSVMVSVPDLAPALVGVKVTLIVQVAFAANVVPQVPPVAPVRLAKPDEPGVLAIAIPLIVNALLPVLLSVTVC